MRRLILGALALLLFGGTSSVFAQSSTIPQRDIHEVGVTELIGINEAVSASQYAASVALPAIAAKSGEFLKLCTYATEDDAGAVFSAAGTLTLFDADPAISAGDAAVTNAEHLTIVAQFTFAAADYISDANGATNCQATNEVFHGIGTLYATWFVTAGETAWNSGATDDEQLEFNLWYRRDR